MLQSGIQLEGRNRTKLAVLQKEQAKKREMERALDPEGNKGANMQLITPVKRNQYGFIPSDVSPYKKTITQHGYEAELRNLKRQNDLLRRTALTNKTY
ncbi:MAG: hypothetical protein M1821_004708 [Bathelium mastoideum]|nr:MAG: hypothetical protein M1821_004708 [Bathelium mastoideum]